MKREVQVKTVKGEIKKIAWIHAKSLHKRPNVEVVQFLGNQDLVRKI